MLKPTAKVVMTGALKDGGLRGRLAALGRGPNEVHVGFPAGKVDAELVQRAVWNEFGTRGSGKGFVRKGKGGKVMGGFGGPIPERPFLRNAARRNQDKYQRVMALAAREIIKGLLTGRSGSALKRDALAKLGALARLDIMDEITAMTSPPNSPLTIALKGSSKPLIDTGEMRRGVAWEIKD